MEEMNPFEVGDLIVRKDNGMLVWEVVDTQITFNSIHGPTEGVLLNCLTHEARDKKKKQSYSDMGAHWKFAFGEEERKGRGAWKELASHNK